MKTVDLQAADNIRGLAVAMVEQAKSGHPGGPMGGADFMHILYSEFLRFDPDNGSWHARDRFFMDAGHLSSLMYAQYSLLDKFTMEDLSNFRQWQSVTPGHPEVDVDRLIENTSGPLGQGHVMGVGAAIAAKFLQDKFEKQFFGVCERLGEKLGISSRGIRLFFIYFSFLTYGSPVFVYLALAFIMNFRKHLRKKRSFYYEL